MKRKFKKGDKVRVKKFEKRPEYWSNLGFMDKYMGQIVEVIRSYSDCIIIFDEERHASWAFKNEDVEPINETIVIYRKDNEVIALDKSTGKKAIARCCPEDKFDFNIGAKLAFERLFEKPPVKESLYNGKICITKGYKDYLTVGKIYEVKDGKFTDNKGYVCPEHKKIKNVDDLRDYFTPGPISKMMGIEPVEFVEVVE